MFKHLLRFFVLCAFVVTGETGCRYYHHRQPASRINVASPETAWQLIAGFYGLESNSYRWTARQFVIALQPPPGAERKGAVLTLRLWIPDTQLRKLGPMTLTAHVNDITLQTQTFSTPGDQTFVTDVPPEALRTNLLPVVFAFNKAVPPAAADGRELAAVVTEAGLQSK